MTSGSAPAAASPPAFETVVVVAVTSWPAPTSIGTSCRPTTPVAPMTKIRISRAPHHGQVPTVHSDGRDDDGGGHPPSVPPEVGVRPVSGTSAPTFGEVVASDPSPGCVRGGTIRGEHRRPGCEAGDPVFEARVTSAQVSAGPERDVLLASKLRVPRPRPGWVSRPRLVEHLRAGLTRDLILVCGPAGFGKSSLLADWVATRDGPSPGSRSTRVTTTRCGSGGTSPPRWTGYCPASASERRRWSAEVASTSIRAAVTALVNDLVVAPGECAARRGRLSPDPGPGGARLAGVPAGPTAGVPARGAGQSERPATAAGQAAGPRAAGRAARRGPALHARRSR